MNENFPGVRDGAEFQRILITGGAGFIGTNLAARLLGEGRDVVIFDNLSRRGVEQNLQWLRDNFGERVQFIEGDMRDARAVNDAVSGATQVFHFAAQVAVTTSLHDPLGDFEINARGALNLLEALRAQDEPASLLFTSTNKVYGHLDDVAMVARRHRYVPEDRLLAQHGIGESRPVCFHSPYGCSKGAADQYVLDYAHTFGLRAAVFRMSCIYGPHQFGNEDQGWVAHFVLQALTGGEITLYGDGRQVRDVLFVEDLVDAFLLAQERIDDVKGVAFNIGGGPENTTSLLELTRLIEELNGTKVRLKFSAWRPADQRYYVSDTRRFTTATGWRPRTGVREGVGLLHRWMAGHRVRDRQPQLANELDSSGVLSAAPASTS
jgi:CDP-paratose 2-epimerase